MDKLGVFHAKQTSMCLTNDVFDEISSHSSNVETFR